MEYMNTPVLETERLIIRKFKKDDIEALYMLLSDEEVNTFLPWFTIKTLDEAKIFYEERFAPNYKQAHAYNYAICLKNNNIPAGYVNVSMDDSYDLGYGLCKELWHNGIVTEACKAVVKQLKKDGISYITATHDINNPRSGGVMQSIGMKYQYSYEECVQPKNILVTFRMYQLNIDGNNKRVYKKYWDSSDIHFIEK
ncbi:MAG: GNAT family N-acetyltransferase [Lachnospiraceae bacterium]|nr:GNAT family N-acetyltransferase [Lachnospiraceae bacterium]